MPDFYKLGMGDPVIMSAYHNLGLEDLMLSIQEVLPWSEQEEEYQEGPMGLAIIGRTNVGKSALINTILGQHRAIVSDVPGTTRDALDTHMEWAGEPVVLIDTAGIRRPGSIKRGIERYSVLRSVQAVQRCDIALLVMDAGELATSQDAHITGLAWDAYKGIIVVVNKSDLLPSDPRGKGDSPAACATHTAFRHLPPHLLHLCSRGHGHQRPDENSSGHLQRAHAKSHAP